MVLQSPNKMVNHKIALTTYASVSKFVTHPVVFRGIICKMEFLPSDNTDFLGK